MASVRDFTQVTGSTCRVLSGAASAVYFLRITVCCDFSLVFCSQNAVVTKTDIAVTRKCE